MGASGLCMLCACVCENAGDRLYANESAAEFCCWCWLVQSLTKTTQTRRLLIIIYIINNIYACYTHTHSHTQTQHSFYEYLRAVERTRLCRSPTLLSVEHFLSFIQSNQTTQSCHWFHSIKQILKFTALCVSYFNIPKPLLSCQTVL